MPEFNKLPDKNKKQQERQRLNKVISGTATTRKPSSGKKIRDALFATDGKSISEWLLFDVIIPTLKDTAVTMLKGTVDMTFYGKADPRKKSGAKVSYDRYYSGGASYGRTDEQRRSRGTMYDYDEVVFETRNDAMSVLTAMEDVIDQYSWISVAGYYDLCEISNHDYTAENYGWVNLRSADVVQLRDGGWSIRLPRAIPRG